MSETRKKVNLGATLREWPEAEKPAAEWDDLAARIDARVAAGDPGTTAASVSNEILFAEPL